MTRLAAEPLGGIFRAGAALAVALLASGILIATPAAADIGGAIDLEHARANARAGGPISDYDAELLERWGNSSGGPDWRKVYRAQRGYRGYRGYGYYEDEPVRVRRHKRHHHRVYR